MAQDFYRLFTEPFGLRGNNKTLSTDYVTMINTVGIQALDEKVKNLEKENADLKSELALMRESMCELNPKARICHR